MKSPEYWAERILEMDEYANRRAGEINLALQKHYSKFYQEFMEQYETAIQPFFDDHGNFDYAKYQKALNVDKRWAASVKDMENSVVTFREFIEEEQRRELYEGLTDTYSEGYIALCEGLTKGQDLIKDFNKAKIEQAVKTPFLKENYSERIWRNCDNMEKSYKKVITTAFTKGTGYKEAAKWFENDMGQKIIAKTSKAASYNCYRLVFTEMRAISSRAKKDSWNDLGVKTVEIIHNAPQCKYCQEMTGKIFDLSKAEIGKELPPYHPNCKGTYAPTVPGWMKGNEAYTELAEKTDKAAMLEEVESMKKMGKLKPLKDYGGYYEDNGEWPKNERRNSKGNMEEYDPYLITEDGRIWSQKYRRWIQAAANGSVVLTKDLDVRVRRDPKKLAEASFGVSEDMFGYEVYKDIAIGNVGNVNAAKKIGMFDKDGKLVKVFNSAKEAEREGYNAESISRVINGKRKTHKGYRWRRM